MITPPRAESIRTLYVQARYSSVAALVVTAYMVVVSWPYSSRRSIAGWLGVQFAAQIARLVLVRLFHRNAPTDAALPRWALAYTGYMALAGAIWGISAFLFIHSSQPITIALTLCGLYGISGGSVPGNAYNLPGLIAFVAIIFGMVLVRLVLDGTFDHVVLGLASAAFAGIMVAFGVVQRGAILETFRIRFENVELLAALRARSDEAEAARAQAESASLGKSRFLAAASHDLRQPLHALGLLVDTLQPLGLASSAGRVITDIRANLAALDGLFNGLLDVARLDAGTVEVRPEAIEADELFDRLDHFLRPTAADRGLDLRFRSDGTAALADPVLLEQILLNLASNALRATQRGGILVAARRRGAKVRFEVWDTGRGIAPADRERIFEEFVQVGNPERSRRMGLGLGLAIARRSARLLGGEIRLASRPGRGSVFWLELDPAPARPALAAALPARTAPMPARSSGRVLVVDDDEAVRNALALYFAGKGLDADILADASQALAALETAQYGVIISDFRMPGPFDGLAFLGHARQRSTATCYLLTGDMDAGLLARAAADGVTLIHKPLSAEQLSGLLIA